MQLSDFDFDLPPELIAQHPLAQRSASRLLELSKTSDGNALCLDRVFADIVQLINPNDLLIFNDTRVIPARLFGQKDTGGRVEILIERITGPNQAIAQIRASKVPKGGGKITLYSRNHNTLIEDAPAITIMGRVNLGGNSDFYEIAFPENAMATLDALGELPLPPYISHTPDEEDTNRYQTVMAKNPGAVAAPTAGLHFDEAILNALRERGVKTAAITLHVGAGTFTPVRDEDLSLHQMHYEWYSIPQTTITALEKTKQQGGKVIAVGTTSIRTLESYAVNGQVEGETNLFITPGYQFKLVDSLITNFHLPKSTLIMLVSAFAGFDAIRTAYQHAIAQRYRFFSYGDAMLLHRN
jgi:S-adenosylmethionine:tRNA ribosyltransferase-isomerase